MAGLEARLVQVGMELLESEGLEKLTLREIARRAGVSHGAPRRYFPTHRQLLAAIARVGLTDLTGRLRLDASFVPTTDQLPPGRLPSDQPRSDQLVTGQLVAERLIAAANAYVGFAADRPEMFRLMFRHDLLQGSGYSLREVSIPLLDRLTALIEQGYPGPSAHDRPNGSNQGIADERVTSRNRMSTTEMTDGRERSLLIWTHVHGIATAVAASTLETMIGPAPVARLVERAVRAQLPL